MRSGIRKLSETKMIENPEAIAGGDSAIEEFIGRLDMKHLPYDIWDQHLRAVRYYNGAIADIEKKIEEQVVKKAEKKVMLRVAQNMVKAGKSSEEILTMTGLSEEEFERLSDTEEDDSQIS